MLMKIQFMSKLCLQNSKLLHSLENSLVVGLNSNNSFSHAGRISPIYSTIFTYKSAHVFVANIPLIRKGLFMCQMELVLQFVSKYLWVRISAAGIWAVDVNNG